MTTTAVPQPATADAAPKAWNGFVTGPWSDGIDVRDFIQQVDTILRERKK